MYTNDLIKIYNKCLRFNDKAETSTEADPGPGVRPHPTPTPPP